MQASKAKVMLVDDHPILRHGMAMLINLNPDMEVIAEAGDREEALAILKAGPSSRYCFDGCVAQNRLRI